jgi:hypothetical protein
MILHEMNMHGTIPENIFVKVTRLTEIMMFKNELTGQIPTTIGFLKDAQRFLFGNNKLGGTLPRQMGLMVDLRSFHVSGNSIGGSLPDLITSLKDLKELGIGRNVITGTSNTKMDVAWHPVRTARFTLNFLTLFKQAQFPRKSGIYVT